MQKNVVDLINNIPLLSSEREALLLHASMPILGLKLDSRVIKSGELFLAYKGANLDGRNYIDDALNNGASFIFYEKNDSKKNINKNLNENNSFAIENLNIYVSQIAANFYNQPSLDQNIYAFTGTNGKTTCSYLLAQMVFQATCKTKDVGLVGTMGFDKISNILSNHFLNKLDTTTPDPILLQEILAGYRTQDVKIISLEASSHALDQGRLSAVNIKTAIFTNLTQDHLDYHQNLEEYYLAKKKLFYFPGVENIIINSDDRYGVRLLTEVMNSNSGQSIMTYGFERSKYNTTHLQCLSYKCIDLFTQAEILLVDHKKNINKKFTIATKLIGDFNISNLLAVLSALYLNDYDLEQVVNFVPLLNPAPGRMESFYHVDNKISIIVDYAHTPDALEKALVTLKSNHKNANIWCIFGCGGDRDKTKRPLMGAIAAKYADKIIITDDNPRTEEPNQIIADIKHGIQSEYLYKLYTVLNNRKQAIQEAIKVARADDVILVAGKGHEDYQIYGAEKRKYNERLVVKDLCVST